MWLSRHASSVTARRNLWEMTWIRKNMVVLPTDLWLSSKSNTCELFTQSMPIYDVMSNVLFIMLMSSNVNILGLEYKKKKSWTILQLSSSLTALYFSSVWYQIISKQRVLLIICYTRYQGDSFHKIFMRSSFLFASIGVSVWVLTLTEGLYWFPHWFSTVLSSFSPSQWQTFCGEKKVRLDCLCLTMVFIKQS